MNRATM